MTNLEIAQLLRQVAAAYQILNENRFKIIAYERAADSIEHLTGELKDLWDDNKLEEVSGLGPSIIGHLEELFKTGKVKYFDGIMSKVPSAVFPLLTIPGLGPKKAYKLVIELRLKNSKQAIEDLEKAAKDHLVAPIEGFGDKSETDILGNINVYRKGAIKENRMVLPVADAIAADIISFLRRKNNTWQINALGSLRRHVSTIGDIDLAVATDKPQDVITAFLTYPYQKLIEKGPTGASLLLHNGRQVDLRVADPESYGAMLQYFTGSKNHNIKLRFLALEKDLSLNEYGIKNRKSGKIWKYDNEPDFYKAIGLSFIEPELREDKGEIESAMRQFQNIQPGLPKLITDKDIRGDLHLHTDYNLEPSHDLGSNNLPEFLTQSEKLKYDYIGISDHNPSITNHSEKQIVGIMKKRKEFYEQKYYSWGKKSVRVFIMCEIDILANGDVAFPFKAFNYIDAAIVSVHSSFTQDRQQMTQRVIQALEYHPKVKIFGHPTGRLLGKREGIDLNWDKIFEVCKKRDIALEINAYPMRLDLPDNLVFDAVKHGIKLCINTDSHAVSEMGMMKYGISVARRGWATKNDIINTLEYNKFSKWLTET